MSVIPITPKEKSKVLTTAGNSLNSLKHPVIK